ncbi:hypothetical protein ES705_09506 [subsurface metagenome]
MKKGSDKSLIEAFKVEENKLKIYKKVQKAIDHWQEYSLEEKGKFLVDIPLDISMLPEEQQEIFIKELVRADICKKRELTKNIKKFKKLKPEEEEPPKTKFNATLYAEMVFKDFYFKADEFGRFYIYDAKNGVYRERAEVYLRHYLRRKYLSDEDCSKHKVSEIVAHIRDWTFTDIDKIEELTPPLNLIPFANCIYDSDKGETIEYSPEYFFTTKMKVKYNPDCGGCPKIDKIFCELVKEEDAITLYEIAAYTFHRDYPYPKIFFLYGSGGNGKSVYSNILTRLVGKRNIATESSRSLQNDKFAGSNLEGKAMNIAMEMEYAVLRNVEMLKRLTGEDLVRSERKYSETRHFYNSAKVIFMGNAIPETIDDSYGWYRRVFLLEFPNKFIIGKNADPNLVRNLPESEIEGLALWSLIKLKELKEKGYIFTRHVETVEVKREYLALSNPLAKFLDDYTERDYQTKIFCDDFYERFSEFLEEKEIRSMASNAVGRKMTDLGFSRESFKREENLYKAYLGLKWKE